MRKQIHHQVACDGESASVIYLNTQYESRVEKQLEGIEGRNILELKMWSEAVSRLKAL